MGGQFPTTIEAVCEAIVGQHFQAVHWEQDQPGVQAASVVRTVMASDVPRTPARRSGEAPVCWWIKHWMAWCWRSTPARLEVERHVGMAIEADRNASHLTRLSARSGPQKTKVCCSRSGETLRTKQHWRLSWHCWQSDTLSLQNQEGESFWSGMSWACGLALCV